MLTFRAAVRQDEGLLLTWRNDPLTCEMSRNTDPVSFYDHRIWLERSLDDPSRQLFICELDGKPVGTMRVDWGNDWPELSWTVSPSLRGKGLGKRMVAEFIRQNPPNYRCEVRVQNTPSLVIAKSLGLQTVILDG